jgi:hypothetical protein
MVDQQVGYSIATIFGMTTWWAGKLATLLPLFWMVVRQAGYLIATI